MHWRHLAVEFLGGSLCLLHFGEAELPDGEAPGGGRDRHQRIGQRSNAKDQSKVGRQSLKRITIWELN